MERKDREVVQIAIACRRCSAEFSKSRPTPLNIIFKRQHNPHLFQILLQDPAAQELEEAEPVYAHSARQGEYAVY